MAPLATALQPHAFEYLLRLGDDRLILGHRLSEWCGHGPILEEDIALGNIALDLIGQAEAFLALAGATEGKGRDADRLAYFRDTTAFRNLQLVEQPRGDFAITIIRQLFFDAHAVLLCEALQGSAWAELAALGAKSLKEAKYHLRHSSEWTLRLGDGTEDSHARAQLAVDELWRFTGELCEADGVTTALSAAGIAPDPADLRTRWSTLVQGVISQATLSIPTGEIGFVAGSRQGRHGEHLGHLLAEMQILPRSYPNAVW